MVLALYLERTGTIHLFFLLIPIWIFATLMYLLLARQFGANKKYNQAIDSEEIELNRKLNESKYLIDNGHLSLKNKKFKQIKPLSKLFQIVSYLSLSICGVLAIFAYKGGDIDQFKFMLFFFTVIYFVSAIIWTREKQKYIYKYGGEEI